MLLSSESSVDQCTTSAFSQHRQNIPKWGNAGSWPPDNPCSAFFCACACNLPRNDITLSAPTQPSTQPCGCHGSKVAGPARPACSLPGEGTTCQRISSHPSVVLIFFLAVCTSELVYLWEVTFHQCTGYGLTLLHSFFISLRLHFSLIPRGLTHHPLFPACSPLTKAATTLSLFLFVYTVIIYLRFWLCAFSALPLNNLPFNWFSLSLLCPRFWFFPSHVSLLCLTLEQSQ